MDIGLIMFVYHIDEVAQWAVVTKECGPTFESTIPSCILVFLPKVLKQRKKKFQNVRKQAILVCRAANNSVASFTLHTRFI